MLHKEDSLLKKHRLVFVLLLIVTLLLSQMPAIYAATSTTSVIPLDFHPVQSALSPDKPVLYLVDSDHQKLHAVNTITKEAQSVSLAEKPRKVVVANNQLYVSLSKSIVALNPDTLVQMDEYVFSQAFSDFEVEKDNIYLGPIERNGPLTYSITQRDYIAPLFYYYIGQTFSGYQILLHPKSNRVYLYNDTQLGHNDIEQAFSSVTQVLSDRSTSVSHYKISLIKASPDGQYLIDDHGQVWDYDLNPVKFLAQDFSDIAFNPSNNNFYGSKKSSNTILIYSYDYDNPLAYRTFNQYATRQASGEVLQLHYQSNNLLAITKMGSGRYQLETIPVPTSPEPQPSYPDMPYLPVDFTPKDLVFDPIKPIAYMTNPSEKKIYAYNYDTQQITSLTVEDTPEQLTFANNKLYVSLVKIPFFSWREEKVGPPGSILVIDPPTMTALDKIPLQENPHEFTVDDQGFLYVIVGTPKGYLSSYSEATKQRIDTISLDSAQPLTIFYSPTNKTLYAGGGGAFSLTVNQGKFGTKTTLLWYIVSNNAVSPDGKFIFGEKDIVDSSNGQRIELGNVMVRNIAFDPANNRYFMQLEDNRVGVYDYKALVDSKQVKKVGLIAANDPIKYFSYQNDRFIDLSLNSVNEQRLPDTVYFKNQHYLEAVSLISDNALVGTDASPEMNSTSATVTSPIVVGFNSFVLDGSNLSQITLKDSANNSISVIAQTANNVVIVIPQSELNYNTTYTLTVPSGAVQSYTGKPNSAYTTTFSTDQEFTRLGGLDRYETSAQIAAKGWDQSDYAVIANGENFPDALSAAPLAKKHNAPILLTQSDNLPPSIEAQITRLGVKNVFLVGGPGVVSPQIQTTLENRGIKITRLWGSDRYETAKAVADALDPSETIFLVSGENFPDALSIASYAATKQIPIFLTPKDSLPPSVLEYQRENLVRGTYIVGGEGVVSPAVSKQSLGYVDRIYGNDRYQTNFAVLQKFNFDYSTVVFANAEAFPDALSASALAALGQHPILLLSPYASQDYMDTLHYNKDMMKLKYVTGGTGVIPDSLMDKIFK
jgi:putative cell wall-binding protein